VAGAGWAVAAPIGAPLDAAGTAASLSAAPIVTYIAAKPSTADANATATYVLKLARARPFG
jgi:hypothetical protein